MRYIVFAWLLLLTIPVFGQSESDLALVYEPLGVENVRLRLSEDDGISLAFAPTTMLCVEPVVEQDVEDQFITLGVFIRASDSPCTANPPMEITIPLPNLDTGQRYVLFLNDFTSQFYLPEAGVTNAIEGFAVAWDTDNPLMNFTQVSPLIDSVDVEVTEEGVTVSLNGNHPDGCITDVYSRVVEDPVQTNLHSIEVFRLLPQEVDCPAQLVEYEDTIDVAAETGDIVAVADRYFRVNDDAVVEVDRVPVMLDSVEILQTAQDDRIVIAASVANDCGSEIEQHSLDGDIISRITLAYYPPLDAACEDQALATDAIVTVSQLPVVINGEAAYDETGNITRPASAQAAPDEVKGNTMRVDTVIESVEVIVLESFPMQLQLNVSGYQPDGCEFPVEVNQQVDDESVTVSIYRNVPADAICPMVLVSYEDTIMVDGSFRGGTVTIDVNGFTTSVDL